jgi:hypothetical protein
MSSQWNRAFAAGKEEARLELAPLVEAIKDTIFMLKDIENARQLPAFAQVQQQYIAMGKQLERLLELSGLEEDE